MVLAVLAAACGDPCGDPCGGYPGRSCVALRLEVPGEHLAEVQLVREAGPGVAPWPAYVPVYSRDLGFVGESATVALGDLDERGVPVERVVGVVVSLLGEDGAGRVATVGPVRVARGNHVWVAVGLGDPGTQQCLGPGRAGPGARR